MDEHAIKEAKKKKTGVNFRYEDLFKLEIDRTRRHRKFTVKNLRSSFYEENLKIQSVKSKFDLICFFFCLHDLTWPTKALCRAKGLFLIHHPYQTGIYNYNFKL